MTLKLIVAGILTVVFLISGRSAADPPAPPPTPANTPAPGVNPDAPISADKYPTPKRDESVQDTYAKSVVIKDPYRWLENADSPETKKFVEDEMAVTKPYLEKSPFRAELTARYTELWNYPRYNGPFQKGKKFFSYQNTGIQNQDVLYVHETLNDEGKVFLDPNTLNKDGTISLNTDDSEFSDDGLVFGYLTSESGSDWNTLQFKHVEQGDIYKEKLTNVKFSSVTWTKDNKGVFYSSFPDYKGGATGSDETKNQKLFYHVLGTEQSKDIMVVDFPENPDYFVSAEISDDGKYLIVTVTKGTDNVLLYVVDLDKIKYEIKGKLDLIPIVKKMEANYNFVTNIENEFIFHTNKDADNYKLIGIDVTKPDPSSWKDLVPEDKKNVMEWAEVAWDKYVVVCYTEDVKSVLQLHEAATGKMLKKFDLEIGTVKEETFYSDKKLKDIYFNFVSFLTPGIVYHCDLSKPPFDIEIFKETKLPNFDRTKYKSEQVFFNSQDGTRIPMYIVYKNGLQKNGKNFAFMIAYGGFSLSNLPYFSVNRLVVVDNFDGIHAVPNIRGGGEYGEQWHRDGSLDKKQNSFNDFQAAAEFLIKEKYTSAKLLAINGESNGGLLMGACLNQRPDLFGAVVADVGLMDMLRYDKFTIGRAWVTEYGTATNDTDFQYLHKYSPLHNIKIPDDPNKQYPATMLNTSDHDDRVPPLHSLKFVATLQFEAKKYANQKNPLLIRVEKDDGHGDGRPTDKAIAEKVDMMSLIVLNTGIIFHK